MRTLYGYLISSLLVVLTGCATTGQQEPQIKRISAEELERIMPKPVPNLSLDELVALSKANTPPEQIIQRIKDSNSSYDLSPSQSVALSKQGVDAKVLDYIYKQRDQVLRDSFADEINRREKEKRAEQDKLKRLYDSQRYYYDPFWGPGFGYGYGPYWRNRGLYGPGFGYRYGW